MDLPLDSVKPFFSKYLMGGWRQDELTFESVRAIEGGIEASVKVIVGFMPSDGVFHFTVPLAFIGVAQLAIILACHEHNLSEKPGEVYLTEINLRCKRMINDTKGIKIRLTCTDRRYVKDNVYYVGDIDVGDGAFIGTGRFISPLPPNFRTTLR